MKKWIENPENGIGARFVGYADELARLNHRGWYIDDYSGEVLRGVVYALPAKRGRRRLLAGYADPHNDGPAYLDLSDLHDDETRAARVADSMAENQAEDEREHNQAWQQGQEWDYMRDVERETAATLRALLAERRQLRDVAAGPTICAELTRRARQMWREIHESRSARAEIWENIPKRLECSFKDGAEI